MSIYNHFRPEERVLVERCFEWAEWAEERSQTTVTNFLDPREQKVLQSIINSHQGIKVNFFGGFDDAERKRAIITPEYLEVSQDDFHVTLLSILTPSKAKLKHRDVLGSLLGLGVKREKFGDILLNEGTCQLLVASEVAGFVDLHLHQVNKFEVRVESLPLEQLEASIEKWKVWNTTVSSLRLDVILSEILPLSRSKATPLIKSGKVKVNWKIVEQPSLTLEEGDILSIKGFGRFLFSKIDGTTKKQRYIVELGKKET